MHTPYVQTISLAEKDGITIRHLDSAYPSAVHIDSTKAVFTGAKADSLMAAYQAFLQGLGGYLKENNFKWEHPTRAWNRIYFSGDGSVDYYLFDFKTPVTDERQARFKELFKAYAQTHKIGISAPTKFAQCSGVVDQDQ